MRLAVTVSAIIMAMEPALARQYPFERLEFENAYWACVTELAEQLWASTHDLTRTKIKALYACQHWVQKERLFNAPAAQRMLAGAPAVVDMVILEAERHQAH